MTSSVKKHRLGLAGEYGVCSELSKREYDVSLTFGNAKAVDIFVHLPDGFYRRIEVKTTTTEKFVTGFFQKYYDKNKGNHPDYWVLVYIDAKKVSHYYILSHQEMGKVQMKVNGMTTWKQIKGCDNVKRALVAAYENKWSKIGSSSTLNPKP